MSMFPFVEFDTIELGEANELLVRWSHKMGALNRPTRDGVCHALRHEGRPVALVAASCLMHKHVGGGLVHLTRANTIELSRLCADRPGLCRVALRLWRVFVLPTMGGVAISYQDADLHTGNTYRFDGWARAAYARAGGRDSRSGRIGRNRYVWVYPPEKAVA